MKAPMRIGLAIGLSIVLTLAVLFLPPKPEPKHGGRPLNDWLTQLVSTYPRMDPDAVQALNAMGEAAVRLLIPTAENDDSPLKKKILAHADRFPLLEDVLPSKFWGRYIAVKALGEMGTNATPAIPTLKKLERGDDPMLASAARAALVLIQNQSIEAIATDYFDYQTPTNSSNAFGLLLELGPHAKSAVPRVLEELQSTNGRVRIGAALVLRHIGVESPECVPVFTNLLSDPDRLMRIAGIDGLANCGPMATSAAPAVVELLEDPESLCRSSALIYLLRVIPPQAFAPYRLMVQGATNDPDQMVRLLAGRVLQEKKVTQ
jgi:HEAT repeat protein